MITKGANQNEWGNTNVNYFLGIDTNNNVLGAGSFEFVDNPADTGCKCHARGRYYGQWIRADRGCCKCIPRVVAATLDDIERIG